MSERKEKWEETRKLKLTGSITIEKVIDLSEKIDKLNESSNTEIKLIINSSGGEVGAALTLYDIISHSKSPVTAIVIGECSSVGVVILQAATQRLATKHSYFYLHPISTVFDKVPILCDEKVKMKFQDKLRGLMERQRMIYEILIEKTKRSLKEIKQKEERVIFAHEAKEFGLIDEVVGEDYKI